MNPLSTDGVRRIKKNIMDTPTIRPGKVEPSSQMPRVLAYFANSAMGNTVIQVLPQMGVRADQLGETPPDLMPKFQGMVLSIPCETPELMAQVEKLCRSQGARVHRSRG
ncbi:MAG: hypothetical protein NT172_12755 [Planctomycetota bacterium]|nr:hypothetical protein [Planctomycetota bacterium]